MASEASAGPVLVRDATFGEGDESTRTVQAPQLTADARRLLDVTLNSFEKLEIAIALHRAEAQTLSVSELGARLRLSSQIIERGIDDLAGAGVLHVVSEHARLILDPRDIPAMDEIAALYDEDRLLVVRTLTEISMDRIRGMAARAFADAFQLRRKKEDGDGA